MSHSVSSTLKMLRPNLTVPFCTRILLATTFIFIAAGCASDSSISPNPNPSTTLTNSLSFDTLYKDLSVSTDDATTSPWGIRTTAGVSPLYAVNFRFAKKPTANGTYRLLRGDMALGDGDCLFFVNLLDGVNSTTYFPVDSTRTVMVTIENGKVHVVTSGLAMAGNRGGEDRSGVSANLLER
jgi:hypothetical protein